SRRGRHLCKIKGLNGIILERGLKAVVINQAPKIAKLAAGNRGIRPERRDARGDPMLEGMVAQLIEQRVGGVLVFVVEVLNQRLVPPRKIDPHPPPQKPPRPFRPSRGEPPRRNG